MVRPVYSYRQQMRAVLLIEAALILFLGFLAYFAWSQFCDADLKTCLPKDSFASPFVYILYSGLRPFVFIPASMFGVLAGKSFGPLLGTLMTVLGAGVSFSVVFVLGKVVGRKLVSPWLHSNLPQTLKFLRSQDWKLMLGGRLVPIVPFDVVSFFAGLMDLRFRYALLVTMLGSLPEAFVINYMVDDSSHALGVVVMAVTLISAFLLMPGIVAEVMARKKGGSLWTRAKAMWVELHAEIQSNNEIQKKYVFVDPKSRPPILLVNGFFSSRRSLTVLERLLTAKGFEVMSFNLGGLFGVFFTKGIIESAHYLAFKLNRQFDRHDFDKISIVAHSKGGLVALWWLLRLGGHKHCSRVVTLGTPFDGTRLTWLALITPLGLFWKDVWQMRPGARLLSVLQSFTIPEHVKIYCLHSRSDKVAPGRKAIFKPPEPSAQVVEVPMNHISHFEFLYKRDVAKTIARLLEHSESLPDPATEGMERTGKSGE